MSFTFYEAAVPPLLRGLNNLSGLLAKAEASGVPEGELLAGRLAPDMHPLPFQVQSVSDSAKGGVARLAGVDVPSMPDVETTLADLRDRLARTTAFIQGVDATRLDGAEDREVVLTFPRGEMRFSGREYLTGFVLPNVYFHITTAYAILRHKGVALGKMDYLGAAR